MSTERIDFKQQRDFGQVINATFGFLTKNFKPLLKNLLLIAGPFFLVAAIARGLMIPTQMGPEKYFSVTFFISLLGGLIGGVLSSGIILTYIQAYINNEEQELTTSTLWNISWSLFLKIFSTNFFYFLFIMLGFVFLIIPGIYLLLAFSFAIVFRVFENETLFGSFTRSDKLIKGYWWKTFGLAIIMTIISYTLIAIFTVPQIILTVIPVVTGMDMTTPIYKVLFIAGNIITQFGSLVMYPIIFVSIVLQYFNLKEIKQGSGLLEKIESIGVAEKLKPEDEGSY